MHYEGKHKHISPLSGVRRANTVTWSVKTDVEIFDRGTGHIDKAISFATSPFPIWDNDPQNEREKKN